MMLPNTVADTITSIEWNVRSSRSNGVPTASIPIRVAMKPHGASCRIVSSMILENGRSSEPGSSSTRASSTGEPGRDATAQTRHAAPDPADRQHSQSCKQTDVQA